MGRTLVAGVAGVVIGAVVVGVFWLGSALLGGSGAQSPAGTASLACQIFDGLPTLTRKNFELPYANRVSAANDLAAAAAKEDSRYHQLSVDATAAQEAVITFNIDTANDKIKAARKDC